ncbi:MAG: DUF1786 domain-containing protein, partial [Methanosarcinales archaeon]|nr:DUF1786 domain-containing protein [Methanosarcinales archaeon]
MPLLAIDVGAGTQDILLYREEVPLEGSAKMIVPSQTVVVAGRIDRARKDHRDVFLRGPTMGGGASTAAVRRHLQAGLRVYATPSAALTIHDNLEKVRGLGVEVTEEGPSGALAVETGDLNMDALQQAFCLFGLDLPQDVAVAVQDHGFSANESNRVVRFRLMRETIRRGGRLDQFAYRRLPPEFSRMAAVRDCLAKRGFRPLLMDTGPAALFGALQDPRCRQPALVLNVGNGHTLGALMDDDRITALFEHHTSSLTPSKLGALVERFCRGDLTDREIFEDGGHGAYIDSIPDTLPAAVVTGPRRVELLPGLK